MRKKGFPLEVFVAILLHFINQKRNILKVLYKESDNTTSTSPKNTQSNNRSSGGRKPFPDSIERKVIEITVPSGERCCSFHGIAMKHFKWEETEKIEVTPAKVAVLKIRREVLHCPACEGKNILRAPTQIFILPKAICHR